MSQVQLQLSTVNPSQEEGLLVEQFGTYRPFNEFSIQQKGYTIKTATDLSELKETFRLRREIFGDHLSEEAKRKRYEWDEFDIYADHIVIVDPNDSVVGTYRVISSARECSFYSETEFDISEFLAHAESCLEVGRACIREDYRTGKGIDLLWSGLARYITNTRPQYLFGVSSLWNIETNLLKNINHYLIKYRHQKCQVFPRNPVSHVNSFEESSELRFEKFLPRLLRSYLMAGATIGGDVTYDPEFDCYDFFTMLNLENLAPMYYKRYFA